MDAQLRQILRKVDYTDPSSYITAATILERAGAGPEDLFNLLERILITHGIPYERRRNGESQSMVFACIMQQNKTKRRGYRQIYGDHFGIRISSNVFSGRQRQPVIETVPAKFSQFIESTIVTNLAPSTSQFLNVIHRQILANGATQCDPFMIKSALNGAKHGFHVTVKVDPSREWKPDYHLDFVFGRSPYCDFFEVSIEDILWWGSPQEVQGIRITGTHHTLYGNEEPEYESPGEPHSTYEYIERIGDVPQMIDEIFQRFRDVVGN